MYVDSGAVELATLAGSIYETDRYAGSPAYFTTKKAPKKATMNRPQKYFEKLVERADPFLAVMVR